MLVNAFHFLVKFNHIVMASYSLCKKIFPKAFSWPNNFLEEAGWAKVNFPKTTFSRLTRGSSPLRVTKGKKDRFCFGGKQQLKTGRRAIWLFYIEEGRKRQKKTHCDLSAQSGLAFIFVLWEILTPAWCSLSWERGGCFCDNLHDDGCSKDLLRIRNSTIGLSANSFERSLRHLRDLLSFADQAAAVDRVISMIIYTNIIITDPVAAVDRVIVIIVVISMVIIVIVIIYFIITIIIMIFLSAIINAWCF